jgi:LysM repeat protein
MNMQTHTIKGIFIWLAVLGAISGHAQTGLYLSFNRSCMDELAYRQAASGERSRAYALSFSQEQYLFFTAETGVSIAGQPPGVLGCRDLVLNQALVDGINAELQPLTIVRQMEDKTYQLLPVVRAMMIRKSGTYFVFRDKVFSGALDTASLVYDVNLAGTESTSDLFLSGVKVYDCRKVYTLRSKSVMGGEEFHVDYAPGIGVASMTKGSSPSVMEYSRTDLVSVNGYELAEWISRLCGSTSIPSVAIPAPDIPTAKPSTPAPVPGVRYHEVAAGETLNAISRQYGVPVANLMAWNNMDNPNLLKRGQRLQVTPPSTTVPVSPQIPAVVPPPAPGTLPTYVVQRGEKIADIAPRFGYTEAYFRQINSLPSHIEVAEGTALVSSDCPCPRTVPAAVRQPETGGFSTEETVEIVESRYTEYTVKRGDSLPSIARQYKISPQELAYINRRKVDDPINPGDKLYVPKK